MALKLTLAKEATRAAEATLLERPWTRRLLRVEAKRLLRTTSSRLQLISSIIRLCFNNKALHIMRNHRKHAIIVMSIITRWKIWIMSILWTTPWCRPLFRKTLSPPQSIRATSSNQQSRWRLQRKTSCRVTWIEVLSLSPPPRKWIILLSN